jgi:hypothetical protein
MLAGFLSWTWEITETGPQKNLHLQKGQYTWVLG